MPATTPPLVSIGIPVRNGAATLASALRSVLEQDYPNLEILISDNASTDATADICRQHAERDPRIRHVRQQIGLSGWENFRYVFDHTNGKYFLWAAADDLRDSNYVSTLVAELESAPDAVIAFSELSWFSDHEEPIEFDYRPYHCATTGVPTQQALKNLYQRHFSYEIYGLIRRSALTGYSWDDTDNGADFLTLVWLLAKGCVIQTPGTCFHYFRDLTRQNAKSRAQSFAYGALRPMPDLRLARHSARILGNAMASEAPLTRQWLWTMRFYWYWKRGFTPLANSIKRSGPYIWARRHIMALLR